VDEAGLETTDGTEVVETCGPTDGQDSHGSGVGRYEVPKPAPTALPYSVEGFWRSVGARLDIAVPAALSSKATRSVSLGFKDWGVHGCPFVPGTG